MGREAMAMARPTHEGSILRGDVVSIALIAKAGTLQQTIFYRTEVTLLLFVERSAIRYLDT